MHPTRSALFALGIANLAFVGGIAPGIIIGLGINLFQVDGQQHYGHRAKNCERPSAEAKHKGFPCCAFNSPIYDEVDAQAVSRREETHCRADQRHGERAPFGIEGLGDQDTQDRHSQHAQRRFNDHAKPQIGLEASL